MDGQELLEEDAYLSEARIGDHVVLNEVAAGKAQMRLALSYGRTAKRSC